MKKKIIMMLVALALSVAAHAQFEQGKVYASTAMSGLDLNFNSNEKWKLDLQAKGGYFFEDSWMVTAQMEYSYRHYEPNYFTVGGGLRYYILQNGIYMGLGANYSHRRAGDRKVDDFMPSIQIGYAFFLSRTVTVEPEIYYNQSLKDHSAYSGVGFRIGFGIYLDMFNK